LATILLPTTWLQASRYRAKQDAGLDLIAYPHLTPQPGWLTTLITAVEAAHDQEPLTRDEVGQLHSIPASMQLPRRTPARSETIAGLQLGIAECSERARAAAAATADATWSPDASAESFSQAAAYATVISHHCQILQQSLAARATQLGATPTAQRPTSLRQNSGQSTARLARGRARLVPQDRHSTAVWSA